MNKIGWLENLLLTTLEISITNQVKLTFKTLKLQQLKHLRNQSTFQKLIKLFSLFKEKL